MEVEGQAKATHFDEQEEGGDRGSEQGVGSDDGVVAERRRAPDGSEHRRGVARRCLGAARAREERGCGDEGGEREEDAGEDGARVGGSEEATGDGSSVDLAKVSDAAAFLEDGEKRGRTGHQHQLPSFG